MQIEISPAICDVCEHLYTCTVPCKKKFPFRLRNTHRCRLNAQKTRKTNAHNYAETPPFKRT